MPGPPVSLGLSGASVWRLIGSPDLFVKIDRTDLSVEAERLVWLHSVDLPTPHVIDVGIGENDGASWLVTTAAPGVPASAPWSPKQRSTVVDSLADIARRLHAVPVTACPFDRRLAVVLDDARSAATPGAVGPDDLDDDRRGATGPELLSRLEASVPNLEDTVVAHNDFCLPNVLIDPDSFRATALVDVGRLGLADRYSDLALMCRSLTSAELNPQFGPAMAERFLASYGEACPDHERLDFYRLLDEFF